MKEWEEEGMGKRKRDSVNRQSPDLSLIQKNLCSYLVATEQNCTMAIATKFLINCFGIEMVLRDVYLKRFDLTKVL